MGITSHAEFNARLGIAVDHFRNHRLRSAEAAYHDLVAYPPAPPQTHYDHAVVLRALGRHREAITALVKFLAAKPNDFQGWTNAGDSARELGSHREALAFFRRALALAPGSDSALSNAAAAHHNISRELAGDDFAAALEHAECAATLAPHDPEYVTALGELQLMSGDYARGWKNYAARVLRSDRA